MCHDVWPAYIMFVQVPYIVSGNYVYVAGQIPVLNGEIKFKGTVPKDKTMDIAYQSARLCGLNIIAQVHKSATLHQPERPQHYRWLFARRLWRIPHALWCT